MAHILIFIHWFVLVFTFGNVELVTIDNSKSNDFPIEELNNYTLREVFEGGNIIINGDFTDGTIGWNRLSSIIVSENGYLKVTPTNLSPEANTNDYNVTLGDSFYTRVDYYVDNLNTSKVLIRIYNASLSELSTSSFERYQWGVISGLFTSQSTSIRFALRNIITTPIEENSFMFDNFYVINQTSIGLSNLTVEQMDDWFNIYQENSEREISETYDYIENELTTNDLIYIVLFALLWGLAIKFVKGVM